MRNKRIKREEKSKKKKKRTRTASERNTKNDENIDLAEVHSESNIELLDKIKQKMALLDQEEKLGS